VVARAPLDTAERAARADRIDGTCGPHRRQQAITNTSGRENNHGSAAISFGIAEQRRIRLGKSDIGGGQAYVHFLRPTFRSADVPAFCFKSVPQFANELTAYPTLCAPLPAVCSASLGLSTDCHHASARPDWRHHDPHALRPWLFVAASTAASAFLSRRVRLSARVFSSLFDICCSSTTPLQRPVGSLDRRGAPLDCPNNPIPIMFRCGTMGTMVG
jgi:hypothetical protein